MRGKEKEGTKVGGRTQREDERMHMKNTRGEGAV
jgi:hypothetical protein